MIRLAKTRGMEDGQWVNIEHLLCSEGGKGRFSFKCHLAAAFCISPITMLRGVDACPPLFDSLVVSIGLLGPHNTG